MRNLRGKRLLLLGGSLWKDAIASFAEQQGIVLLATGNNQNAGIFEIAKERYNIDSTDAEQMKKLIREKHIDGVYLGGSEPVISAACQYLSDLGMPCYCTKQQWDALQNKSALKRLLCDFGLPVAPSYSVTHDTFASLPASAYPVITKPADGCGSSGFSICRNQEELERGYEKAEQSSASGRVVIEKFVKNEAIVAFYTFSNGEMHFVGIEDKFPVRYETEGSYVAGLMVFKSRLTARFRELYEEKLRKMFASIGLREGSLWLEVFHDGENFTFNEAGYRYGGELPMYPISYYFNSNQIVKDINYALTGESSLFEGVPLIPDSVPRKQGYAIYLVHLNPGRISKVFGLDDISALAETVVVSTTKRIGDDMPETGSFSQIYAIVHFVFDDAEELRNTIEYIHGHLVVENDNGENMVHRMLDMDRLVI